MTLKPCPCCQKINTTKTATFIGRLALNIDMLWFNCKCGGTFVICAAKKGMKYEKTA